MDEVHSVADYIECLKRFRRNGLEGFREKVSYYYRGEPRDYGKTAGQPQIARDERFKGDGERTLFRECERRLPEAFAGCRSTFEKLVLMQHYQIPTRLLDISLDPLIALFFALHLDARSKKDDSRDAVVLVYEIPENSIKDYHSDTVSVISNIAIYSGDTEYPLKAARSGTNVKEFNEEKAVRNLVHEIQAEKPYFEERIVPEHLESVVCVHPKLSNSRIKVQQGAFLLFGMQGDRNQLATLDKNKEIRVRKIRIPQAAKGHIREELQILSRTVDTIYPDWDGVSDFFARFYKKPVSEFYK